MRPMFTVDCQLKVHVETFLSPGWRNNTCFFNNNLLSAETDNVTKPNRPWESFEFQFNLWAASQILVATIVFLNSIELRCRLLCSYENKRKSQKYECGQFCINRAAEKCFLAFSAPGAYVSLKIKILIKANYTKVF